MHNLPETFAALGAFGMVFVCPLVFILTRHQRAMAELFHRQASGDTQQRVENLEREVQMLKAAQYDQILRQDDVRNLSNRINS